MRYINLLLILTLTLTLTFPGAGAAGTNACSRDLRYSADGAVVIYSVRSLADPLIDIRPRFLLLIAAAAAALSTLRYT